MVCVLLVHDPGAIGSLSLARRIAAGSGEQFTVLCAVKGAGGSLEERPPDADDLSELARLAHDAIGSANLGPIPVFECRAPNLVRAVLDALTELGARRLVVHSDLNSSPGATRSIVGRLMKRAPVNTVILSPASDVGEPGRILIPQMRGGGTLAIRLAGRCFAADGTETIAIAEERASSRSRRVFGRAVERLPDAARRSVAQSFTNVTLEAWIRSSVKGGDLVLLDAEDPKLARKLAMSLADIRKEKAGVPFGVAVVRPEFVVGPGQFERAYERFRSHVPRLSRDERRQIHETLERGGRISVDFVVMLMLSASIASFGLIQSSSATVIGAMLVAPLMTPILAIAMALVQGNARLFGNAWRALGVGILGALLASIAIGLLSPWSDLSSEIVARGSPNPFDLGTALLSGVAAAFALARAGLAGTLVGVAIAVALVPPLAAVGIATVKSEFAIAFGATTLFLTNLLAIVVGAFLVFRIFGLDAAAKGRRSPRWVMVTLGCVAIALAPTTGVLFRNLKDQTTQGVHRPYSRPLPAFIRAQIVDRISMEEGMEVLFMSESDIEHGFGREVAIMTVVDVDPSLVDDLRSILAQGTKPGTPVRVLLLRGTAPTP